MHNSLIVDQSEFDDLCSHIREKGIVAFDTEFVSEYTYRPELCLVQLATDERCVAVDPYSVKSLDAWWDIMVDDTTMVVAHAGREEVRFCLRFTQQRPRRLFDVQIAEGLRSRSYPLGYERLISRVVGHRVSGKETRTDWRRRPLSDRQISYALDDVKYLLEVWKRQSQSLQSLDRTSWADSEFQRMIDEVAAEGSEDSWRRLSGVHKLNRRELAVARELMQVRERASEERNQPARRVLRDDLILDLAKRQPRTSAGVLDTRDMTRYKRLVPELVTAIVTGLDLPESQLPLRSKKPDSTQDEHVLSKLLALALSNRCAELDVSTTLVGTSSDLRELVRWHIDGNGSADRPRLSAGWRADVCGDLLTDLLDGRIAIRVSDPQSDHPLVFESRDS